jgi:hypothetical protein
VNRLVLKPYIYLLNKAHHGGLDKGMIRINMRGINQKNDQCKCHVMWSPHTTGSLDHSMRAGSLSLKVHPAPASMTSKASKTRLQLVSDIWANVCDILIDSQQDGTAAALACTSKEIRQLVTPRLYDTVRIRNFEALSRFSMVHETRESPSTSDSTSDPDDSALPDPPQSRMLIRHIDIVCELPRDDPLPDPWTSAPLQRLKTCHVTTVEGAELEDPLNSHMQFIDNVAYQIPSEHFRWQHIPANFSSYLYPYCGHTTIPKDFNHKDVRSVEFPPMWQSRYDHRITAAVFWQSRATGNDACGGTWYTDPDQTEAAGHRYLWIRDRKPPPGSRKPMYIVQIAQPDGFKYRAHMDESEEMAFARRTAGSLTDFAMMEKMGLLDVKLVCLPEQRTPSEWREWILGEGTIPGNGVQADLKAIVE